MFPLVFLFRVTHAVYVIHLLTGTMTLIVTAHTFSLCHDPCRRGTFPKPTVPGTIVHHRYHVLIPEHTVYLAHNLDASGRSSSSAPHLNADVASTLPPHRSRSHQDHALASIHNLVKLHIVKAELQLVLTSTVTGGQQSGEKRQKG